MAKGRNVKPNEDVNIIWNGDKHHKAGQPGVLHAAMADKMVEAGKASYPADYKPKKESK